MNAKAHSLGLSQTYFLNVTGLDINSTISGGYGSAKDMAKLFTYAVKTYPDVFEATSYPQISVSSIGKTKYQVDNTDTIVGQIPGLIASKTGYTDLALGNLAILFDAGLMHPIAIVVLGSTEEGRFTDTISLVNKTLDFITESPK
jgi:D-alanyl-D-alanine carboxypeptidase